MPEKTIHLAAHFPGVNNTTVWADPRSRSQIELASFVELARTAERGGFDFFFLAEGLRLREYKGRIHDLDVVGRPDNLTVLSALAAVTTHLGLAGTVNSTFNEPFDIAGRLATLDHLSGGRAAWNVVTSFDEFTGENFRRGGFLAEEDRYTRAIEFLAGRFSGLTALLAPPVIAGFMSASLLSLLHRIGGTPEIVKTIAVPLTVATSYAALYNYSLWRTRKA